MKRLSLLAIVGALSLAACSNGASSLTPAQGRDASFVGGIPAAGLSGAAVPAPTPTATTAPRAAQFVGGIPANSIGGLYGLTPVATPTPAPAPVSVTLP